MYNILVVDDDKEIVESIEIYLKNEGFNIFKAYNGIEALEILVEKEIHLILMDIMMPKLDGIKATIKIREEKNIPIILVSAKSEDTDKIIGLNIGADDYITKPFDLGEVIARIESNLRRYSISAFQTSLFTYKDISLDENTKEVKIKDNLLDLTAKEYMILELLLKNQNKVFSKANLYESIWHEEYIGDDNVIKTHISNIRSKLKKFNKNENYIETVWGLGYRLFKK